MNSSKIIPSDIPERNNYIKVRKDLRKKMVLRKKNRRLNIGPYITVYFENKDTLIHQIREMVFIENGGHEQVLEEIRAYESLVPNGKELVLTLMVEIDNQKKRSEFLSSLGGIECSLILKINGTSLIKGQAEKDVDRTNADGKASSVQFIHFSFNKDEIFLFQSNNSKIELEIDHPSYKHIAVMNTDVKNELSKDFL